MTVKYCPFQETVPVSLQVCLTMSQKILETFEGIDKKDLNQEKIVHLSTLSRGYAEEHLSWEKSILALQDCMLLHPRSPS